MVKNANVSPDTLSTLMIGTLNANSPYNAGEGYFVLEDAQTEVRQIFNFASKQEEISYLRNGATLFRGSFNYSNKKISSQFRVPKDISFSGNPSKIRFNVNNGIDSVAIGSVSNINLSLGPPSSDTQGPIITFETSSGRILRSGDNINRSEEILSLIHL